MDLREGKKRHQSHTVIGMSLGHMLFSSVWFPMGFHPTAVLRPWDREEVACFPAVLRQALPKC